MAARSSSSRAYDSLVFVALACATTWLLALPTARAWIHHAQPSPPALLCAGLSAFGPLFAALIVAGYRKDLRPTFGRWRTSPKWILFALATPFIVHMIATLLFAASGGTPDAWVHPPASPEAWAALVVFPLGEEFGWRGFLQPRAVERFGPVRGSLLVGLAWGAWHLAYTVTPAAAGFDPFELGLIMTELPLYSVIFAWVFERGNRSMAVAIAFHAGAHLDHLETAPRTDLRIFGLHLAVVAIVAVAAGRSLNADAKLARASAR